MDFLSLPVVMIENIFSYLTYDEIAKNRVVSKAFNEISMRMLNRGFLMIERRHALALKSVKAQLPRRESERRYHPLSRHCDILTSIETRISMLNMTYSKFIDCGMCCFIPGKVIDEIKRVLAIVETSKTPPRAHEVLQELRDISSMAIEHFDDKISPAFRKKLQEGVSQPVPRPPHALNAIVETSKTPPRAHEVLQELRDISSMAIEHFDDKISPAFRKKLQEGVSQPVPRPPHAVLAPLAIRQEMINLRRRSILNAKLSLYLAKQYKKVYDKMIQYKKIAWRQHRALREVMKKQRDQDANVAELKKRIEECDIKYSELTHTNQAVGGKVIAAASATEASSSGQPLRHFGSQIKLDLSVLPIGTSKRNASKMLPNIKPRKPMIKLPSLSEDDTEPPPKVPKLFPLPSTSASPTNSPKPKPQSTIAKIRGITNEIRQLSDLSRSLEGKLKRPLNTSEEKGVDTKKQKVD